MPVRYPGCLVAHPPVRQLPAQVSHPSAERRTLMAELLGEVVGLVDMGTQAHCLLTQLHRLAEDRLEQVGVGQWVVGGRGQGDLGLVLRFN